MLFKKLREKKSIISYFMTVDRICILDGGLGHQHREIKLKKLESAFSYSVLSIGAIKHSTSAIKFMKWLKFLSVI